MLGSLKPKSRKEATPTKEDFGAANADDEEFSHEDEVPVKSIFPLLYFPAFNHELPSNLHFCYMFLVRSLNPLNHKPEHDLMSRRFAL